MIRLPANVHLIRDEKLTLRFGAKTECGYVMLFEAGSANLGHQLIALDWEVDEAPGGGEYVEGGRSRESIEAAKQGAINAHNASRYVDGEGQHCLMFSVGEAISMVRPIESIIQMSDRGQPVTAHPFTPAEVAVAARAVLERIAQSIQQVSEAKQVAEATAANAHDLGMFSDGPGADPQPA